MAEEKEDTKFKTGNQVWKARSSHGRKPIFKNEDELWKAASEYFEYVEDNPFITYKGVLDKDNEITQIPQYHPKPFTIGGLCVFLDISRDTLTNYRKNSDFIGVTKALDEVIRDQKLSGAAAGLFHHNIIARDIGLKEASSVEVTVPEGLTFINNFGGKDE